MNRYTVRTTSNGHHPTLTDEQIKAAIRRWIKQRDLDGTDCFRRDMLAPELQAELQVYSDRRGLGLSWEKVEALVMGVVDDLNAEDDARYRREEHAKAEAERQQRLAEAEAAKKAEIEAETPLEKLDRENEGLTHGQFFMASNKLVDDPLPMPLHVWAVWVMLQRYANRKPDRIVRGISQSRMARNRHVNPRVVAHALRYLAHVKFIERLNRGGCRRPRHEGRYTAVYKVPAYKTLRQTLGLAAMQKACREVPPQLRVIRVGGGDRWLGVTTL